MFSEDGLIQKTVYYFLFELTGESEIHVQTEEGISDANWMTIEEAQKVIGYPKTNIRLLEEVQNFYT